MLDVGVVAPDFALPGTPPHGYEDVVEYGLSATLSRRPVLLNFYTFDFHPACRTHVRAIEDLPWAEFDTDVAVYGISTDSAHSHLEFARQESLDFPLLSDSDGDVAEDYGVLANRLDGHRRVARRSVFVVDQSKRVRYAWQTRTPSRQPDWSEVEGAIEDLSRSDSAGRTG